MKNYDLKIIEYSRAGMEAKMIMNSKHEKLNVIGTVKDEPGELRSAVNSFL